MAYVSRISSKKNIATFAYNDIDTVGIILDMVSKAYPNHIFEDVNLNIWDDDKTELYIRLNDYDSKPISLNIPLDEDHIVFVDTNNKFKCLNSDNEDYYIYGDDLEFDGYIVDISDKFEFNELKYMFNNIPKFCLDNISIDIKNNDFNKIKLTVYKRKTKNIKYRLLLYRSSILIYSNKSKSLYVVLRKFRKK